MASATEERVHFEPDAPQSVSPGKDGAVAKQPTVTKPDPYIYLSNLPVEAYEGIIRQAIEDEGIAVASIHLLQKGSSARRRNAGLAEVKLASAADAQRSCELLDGKLLHVGADTAQGRPMIVRRGKFESCQFGYNGKQQQDTDGSDADAADTAELGCGLV